MIPWHWRYSRVQEEYHTTAESQLGLLNARSNDLSPRPHVVVPYPYPSSPLLSISDPGPRAESSDEYSVSSSYESVYIFLLYIFTGEYFAL